MCRSCRARQRAAGFGRPVLRLLSTARSGSSIHRDISIPFSFSISLVLFILRSFPIRHIRNSLSLFSSSSVLFASYSYWPWENVVVCLAVDLQQPSFSFYIIFFVCASSGGEAERVVNEFKWLPAP